MLYLICILWFCFFLNFEVYLKYTTIGHRLLAIWERIRLIEIVFIIWYPVRRATKDILLHRGPSEGYG
uniref:Putative secreted protein n=1 Tax=Anopheles darlingi TaxID=43151 RepID=A0A2M4DCM3_ANODA